MKTTRILALILVVLGLVLLVVGIYQFVEFRQSAGGKIASFGNQLSKAFGGSSSIAKGYFQPIALIVSGIIAGAVGFVLYKKS